MDNTTRTYIQIGFIGAIIGILSSAMTSFQLYLIYWSEYMYDLMILISWPLAIISSIDAILFGIGFLGLSYKYAESSCKAVFFMSIADVIAYSSYTLFSLIGGYPAYESVIFLLLVINIVGFVWTLSIAFAVWRIANRTPRPDVSKTFAILTIAGPVLYGIMGIISMIAISIILAILTLYFFQLERTGAVKQIVSSW